jgi:hypothetical protein
MDQSNGSVDRRKIGMCVRSIKSLPYTAESLSGEACSEHHVPSLCRTIAPNVGASEF